MSKSKLTGDEASIVESKNICVVGLGYVGLPLAEAFCSEGHDVCGLDINQEKINKLKSGTDPTGDVGSKKIEECDIDFTTNPEQISNAEIVVVAVPTPVDDLKKPDLSLVENAGKMVGDYITQDTLVVLESTVYPGATNEVFIPAIEETSKLTGGESLKIGYSPERMVPGDAEHGLKDVVKIVSALTDETLSEVAGVYETIVDAGVHQAPTIETAEAAKCVENIQRDLNIALVNELAIACDHLDLDTNSVLEAAGTKWNFHDYKPGLVGGHCIPVDPFYLIYESEQQGFDPELIQKAREINEYVPKQVAEMTIKALNQSAKVLQESRILVLGLSYKPGVDDIRTSAISGVISELKEFGVEIVGYDPHANNDEMREEFEIKVQDEMSVRDFDGLLIGTPHGEFDNLPFDLLTGEMAENPVVVDVDGTFEEQINYDEVTYRRL